MPRFYSLAVIRVAEIPVTVYRKGVSSIFRIYNKLLSILYKSDRHFYLRQALKIAAAKCQRLYRGDRSPFRYRTSAAAFFAYRYFNLLLLYFSTYCCYTFLSNPAEPCNRRRETLRSKVVPYLALYCSQRPRQSVETSQSRQWEGGLQTTLELYFRLL